MTHPINLLTTQFIEPERIKSWFGLVGWPIADGLPTLSGHPSATDRAWDRASSPVTDWRSTTDVPRNQCLLCLSIFFQTVAIARIAPNNIRACALLGAFVDWSFVPVSDNAPHDRLWRHLRRVYKGSFTASASQAHVTSYTQWRRLSRPQQRSRLQHDAVIASGPTISL